MACFSWVLSCLGALERILILPGVGGRWVSGGPVREAIRDRSFRWGGGTDGEPASARRLRTTNEPGSGGGSTSGAGGGASSGMGDGSAGGKRAKTGEGA